MTTLLTLATLLAADRVLLVSLDGLGHHILSTDAAARELRVLHHLARRGSFRPLRTTFPSKTSAGHAAIFTGKWAGENGVFSNTNPRAPRAQFTLADTITGFRSESLTSEPLWTSAARQGIPTVAYQVTQAYPFTNLSAGLDLPQPPIVVNGYQTKLLAPHRVLRERDLAASGQWTGGALTFQIERQPKQALRITHHGKSVTVQPGRFSAMLPVADTGVYFRLWTTPQGFLLLHTSIHAMGASGLDAQKYLQGAGAFIGNTPTALYRRGELGATLAQGGDGTAERRYLECFAFITQRMTEQMLWLDRTQKPRLFAGYYPQVDDLEHVFYGLSRQGKHPQVDAVRREAYGILSRHLAQLTKRFRHVIITSDHGMAPATHRIHMGALLTELGYPETKARANASCIFLNTADWREGTIPLAQAPAERERLAALLDRHRLITAVYRHADLPAYGLTGDRQPDVCFDVLPGHYPEDSAQFPVVQPYESPEGEHGLDPNRTDMKAILVTNRPGVVIHTVAEVASLVWQALGR